MGISRRAAAQIARSFRVHPIATLLGARQVGKTTLARAVAATEPAHWFDLEDPEDDRALANPRLVLGGLSGLVVLDEIQRRPDLFPILRALVDRPDNSARFLLLGSASPSLVKGVSETLAGRTGRIDVSGFDLGEVGGDDVSRLWLRGGLPRSFLAEDDAASAAWRQDYLRTVLERDLPQLGITVPAATLRRFWTMLAHFHGQIWNQAELARSLGVSEKTAGHYRDILEATFLVRVLRPWHENLGKRLVKSPKVYLTDSGLAHSLLGIADQEQLWSHPKAGASWEGFALHQVLARFSESEPWFWATQAGAELDLLLDIGGKRFGFEFKLGDAPSTTKSMASALADLELERLFVVYPGNRRFPLKDQIEALPLHLVPTFQP